MKESYNKKALIALVFILVSSTSFAAGSYKNTDSTGINPTSGIKGYNSVNPVVSVQTSKLPGWLPDGGKAFDPCPVGSTAVDERKTVTSGSASSVPFYKVVKQTCCTTGAAICGSCVTRTVNWTPMCRPDEQPCANGTGAWYNQTDITKPGPAPNGVSTIPDPNLGPPICTAFDGSGTSANVAQCATVKVEDDTYPKWTYYTESANGPIEIIVSRTCVSDSAHWVPSSSHTQP